jgi:ATP-dependent protease ClpP protease subunit
MRYGGAVALEPLDSELHLAGLTSAVEQITTDVDEDCCFTAPEAVAYGLAEEVIGGPAGAPESGTSA